MPFCLLIYFLGADIWWQTTYIEETRHQQTYDMDEIRGGSDNEEGTRLLSGICIDFLEEQRTKVPREEERVLNVCTSPVWSFLFIIRLQHHRKWRVYIIVNEQSWTCTRYHTYRVLAKAKVMQEENEKGWLTQSYTHLEFPWRKASKSSDVVSRYILPTCLL